MPFMAEVRCDEIARIWYLHDSDLPGLHAEAATLDELVAVIRDVTPDLAADLPGADGGTAGASPEITVRIQHVIVARSAHAA